MEISAECRWFWRVTPYWVGKDLFEWFKNRDGFLPGGGELRIDEYLLDRNQSELGIKRRGGRPGVEVKGLVRRTSTNLTVGAATAPTEIWGKWTTEVLSLDSFTTMKTEKTRWLRKYEMSSNQLKQIPLGKDERPLGGRSLPEAGCNVELTFLKTANGVGWVTFGLEAFGDFESLEHTVQMTSVEMTDSDSRRLLTGHVGDANVLVGGYPLWLDYLLQTVGTCRNVILLPHKDPLNARENCENAIALLTQGNKGHQSNMTESRFLTFAPGQSCP